ncbi:MAG: hypothetical protein EHM59_16405 [Betaproteobacteria bacterium]|nr:MAG: hypothetical protein EHM59_16405 [Betaproteobacteria bacterium]
MATRRTKKVAMSEMRVSIDSQLPFDQIVAVLKAALTVPELPGVRGCRPCLSGLDRFIIEDIVMKGMR